MAVRLKSSFLVALIGTVGLLLFWSAPVSAAFPIAKNGKIHACYKAKGKKRGQLRVFRGARVRCPKKWRRISWYAGNPAGVPGTSGPQGQAGTNGNVAVEQLEDRVSELLAKVESLEAILSGITNLQLLAATSAVPAVQALCTQTSILTDQVSGLKLNAVLTTLGGVLEVPMPPGAPSAFSCPS